MQSYADFTVGGSLSVNVHGRYIGHGPIVSSVKSFRVVLADGRLVNCSRLENKNIFYASIGGYGGLGVIADVTLGLSKNVKVRREVVRLSSQEYHEYFQKNIEHNPDVVFHNANFYPPKYDQLQAITYHKTNDQLTNNDHIAKPENKTYLQRWFFHLIAKSTFGKWLRRVYLDPKTYQKKKVVWKNWEASYHVDDIEPPNRKKHTYALREYFIPTRKFTHFLNDMSSIFNQNKVNVLNVSIRHAKQDLNTYLSWAKEDVYAFVVYYVQKTDPESQEKVKRWSQEMINAAISHQGSYYLPYQLHATQTQFEKAYPRAQAYFEIKDTHDPHRRFDNMLLKKYGPQDAHIIKNTNISFFDRNEEQTFLTIPEWYIVDNQKEYANFIQHHPPHDFPFIKSIQHYRYIFDKSIFLSRQGYAINHDYEFMLKTIGYSLSLEYVFKAFYEHTLGRVFSMLFGMDTEEDRLMKAYHQNMHAFMHHSPWYKYDYFLMLKKTWRDLPFFGESWPRKIERKMFFSAEMFVKAIYSHFVQWHLKDDPTEKINKTYLTLDINKENSKKPYQDKYIALD